MARAIEANELACTTILQSGEAPLVRAYAVAISTQRALYEFRDLETGVRRRNLTAAKRSGTFFTPPEVALEMAELALHDRQRVRWSVEPACGTGMLTAALLVTAVASGRDVKAVSAWELSPYLANLASEVLRSIVDELGTATRIEVVSGDAVERFLAIDRAAAPDLVLLNPPYGRVKYLRSEASNAETRASDVVAAEQAGAEWVRGLRERYARLARHAGLRPAGLDHQRLFIAASFGMLAGDGRIVCIAPSAWLSGQQSTDLRKVLLSERSVWRLSIYPEDAKLFETVNQPTAVFAADRGHQYEQIGVVSRDRSSAIRDAFEVDYFDVLAPSNPHCAIALIAPAQRVAYEVLRDARRVKDFDCFNARGEVDLTSDSWMLSSEPTATRLVRGDHVRRFDLAGEAGAKASHIVDRAIPELRKRPKWEYVVQTRLASRQVAYMGKRRRLEFVEVPAGTVLANSCNFIVAPSESDRHFLSAVLNSSISEWWFRVHNSNNHVSNGEIDALPLPSGSGDAGRALAALGELRSHIGVGDEFAKHLDAVGDALVAFAHGLSAHAARSLVEPTLDSDQVDSVERLVDYFHREGVPAHMATADTWLQHRVPTLSALDIEMIGHVPVGGNWQSIPDSVPSARLRQIRQMSADRGVVRTTYYGRLRPDQPSYTVATYYNRPGNGTNIHPTEDRTLTHREAARLQSFQDEYSFIGGDGAIRKQIGNAVPPLLARAVGEQVATALGGAARAIDLFAGAGGLSTGMALAGVPVLAAVDNDLPATRTYAFNHSTEMTADPASRRTLLMRADLSDPVVRETTYAALRQKVGAAGAPLVLAGGPPCQGFSYAGFRNPNDSRSDLAIAFLDFVEALEPDAVVMENVEGLLTAKGGRVVSELMSALRSLGYSIEAPWVLAAEQFGVPQMRRRVFLVAARGQVVQPPTPIYDRCLGRREDPSLRRNTRYPVTAGEALSDLHSARGIAFGAGSDIESRAEYAKWASGTTRTLPLSRSV